MCSGKIPWNKGLRGVYKCSKETKRKMSEAHMGIAPWNKGLKGVQECSDELRRKRRLFQLGRKVIGRKKLSKETKQKIRETNLRLGIKPPLPPKGKDSHFWKGGITPINQKIRSSLKYKKWRNKVFIKDNWTCQNCAIRGFIIHAHHIKPFSKYPKLRFHTSNGITLCSKCHRKLHQKTEGRHTPIASP
jgi:hypothetical protein